MKAVGVYYYYCIIVCEWDERSFVTTDIILYMRPALEEGSV